MTAGNQYTNASVNAQAASLVIGLTNILASIQRFQASLTAVGAAGLEAAPISMSSGDAATMISAFNDLNDIATIWNGGTSIHLTGTYAYTQFAKLLAEFT